MDEKEVIEDIRWEFSRGKSRAEITRILQEKGLKLEFIDSLISRARRPKKRVKSVLMGFLIIFLMWASVYGMFFYHNTETIEYTPSWTNEKGVSANGTLEITPELISLVASEMGADKLRTNPLNLKKPIMNFDISGRTFHTIVNKKIETFEGTSSEADLLFSSDEKTLEQIFSSGDIKENIKNAIIENKIQIEKISSDQELFLKGYLALYEAYI